MAKTYRFTRVNEGGPIGVVLDKILTVEIDHFAGGTQITFINGESVTVRESLDDVTAFIEGSK